MASDLISRDALLAEYDRVHVGEPGRARKLIAEAPAVDAVEVVRCKDCERGEPSLIRNGEILCEWWRCHTRCDGFCHMGVKKDAVD